ncbi:aminotransferase class I/II-fold pyridoxal phosphate-dependent enzyme [Flammeovirga kamogawensis]|uniref:Aminotransferase class I/II-fold pyridoxal phosphate-dependent enzyme n=1 Tax=Flammeovirga kamogawensis TaxID=373891 RepID=A0ABX8GUS2_9BACT|nr:aminotransferase class I/II-fold pyridoxal phosphate-dependent enzyme [Flammeovirga kamogawensis]MBB6459788.1 DNA-binding transcriptional MocR family regulator [Flammeovirga kamogawensis]QWG07154.1 aminotransferase class I/II-fold pyridoxal phosphate-dependent enzyme [Flammeovirga kamogawensis]TRX68976.1 aminotransferase class I/II-fold pyridoxal phosphate-dependent enzyme [Flammeovirga kamogawensis]
MASLTKKELQKKYDEYKAQGLALDMTRGKPGAEQLDLSLPMLDLVTSKDYKTLAGADTRNYGGLDGIPEMKEIFKDFLEVSSTDEVIVGGNSSLTLMHDTIARAMSHGFPESKKPWGQQSKVKFLCPSPGYDRHFSVCEHFGIEMITVPMTDKGPDMDVVEKLVAEDKSIKGIWVVPKYSNPTGITCSKKTVKRLAKMTTAAKDFRIMWDNAYTVHHLSKEQDELENILEACKKEGNDERVLIYGSFSKISFAGAGVAGMGASASNINWMKAHLSMSTIGPDKINQVRHARFFKDFKGVQKHMKKHAAIIAPKFDAVIEILEKELGGKKIATWTVPKGGYFISLDVPKGTAKQVVKLASDAGVKLTAAGATFPYMKDPKDENIRIAPTLPSMGEIKLAMRVLAVCVQLAAAKK